MDTLRNFHISGITNTPGASGALVLGAAQSGYMTWGAADDGLPFTVVIKDSSGTESRTGCVYTHSTRTLSAGAFDDSTTGSPIAFTSAAVVAATPLIASLLRPVFSGAGGVTINVRSKYGTNHAAIVAAVAELNASTYGGVLYFSGGSTFSTTGGHVITKRCILLGDGAGDMDPQTGTPNYGLSDIACTVGNVNGFELQAPGSKAFHVTVRMSAGGLPTSGWGLFFSAADGVDVDHCYLADFYCPLRCDGGQTYRITNNNICGGYVNAWLSNAAIPDGGDCVFAFNNMYGVHRPGAAYSLYAVSGGGLKIQGNKFNGGNTGDIVNQIRVELLTTAPASQTVILMIQGNSIENALGDSVKVTATGTGAWNQILVNSNQFGHYANGPFNALRIDASATGKLDNVIVQGNLFAGVSGGSSGAAVYTNNVNNLVLGPNCYLNFATRLTTAGATSVRNFDALA